MIVIARSYGQLGNRLFLYAHLIAAARHYGVALANPCFANYAELFPATAGDLWCRYPRVPGSDPPPTIGRRRRLEKTVYAAARCLGVVGLNRFPMNIIRLRGDETCDLGGGRFASLANQNRYLLVLGWLFRNETLLERHSDVIREHFRIRPAQQANVERAIRKLRDRADVVVGVHIRHGDYANFLGGKYYYTTEQYASAMRQVVDQLPGRKVAFLVCSNVPPDVDAFGGLDVQLGPGDIVEDMYSFAETDFLIGPPSTYTGWASFYGRVPLAEMHHAEQAIDVSAIAGRRAA